MKRNVLAGLVVAALVLGGSVSTVLAQSAGKQGNGKGYGGPPQSQEERAARQADCGPRQDCPGLGQGKGQGKGARKGLRDGTGPRAQAGTCPIAPAK
jgi:hypothetical protein